MPYTVKKDKGRWCVYKKGSDGEPSGDTLGCHDTEDEAVAQIGAIESNEERGVSLQGLYQQVSEKLALQSGEGSYPWLNDIYHENGQIYAILSSGGKLYRMPLMIDGSDVVMGSLTEVEAQFQSILGGDCAGSPLLKRRS